MNILLVHNYYRLPGGEDIVVANEKRMLEKHGHKVFLYTKNNCDIDTGSLYKKILLACRSVFSFKTYKEVYRLIKKENIKIVHVHNTLSLISPSVYYATIRAKASVVQTMHNFRLICPAGTFYHEGKVCEKCLKKGMCQGIIRKCYRESYMETFVCAFSIWFNKIFKIYGKINFIALTEFNKRKLLTCKFIDKNKVYVKPNFVPDNSENDKIKLMSNEDYYLYAGRLENLKGIDVIIKAWELMGKDAPRLIICGNGDKEKSIKNKIEKGLLFNVEMKGYVSQDELHSYMSKSRALIYPSQCYETFGMGIIESYMLGTPVIVSKLGNPGSLVKDRVTGLKFTHNSAEDLIDKIKIMSNYSADEYEAVSKNASECYLKNFTEEANYIKLMEIYKKILS